MKSIDKAPFWTWPLGAALFGGIAAVNLLAGGRAWALIHLVGAMAYAAGLGRALLRRELAAQGVRARGPA
ncbi:hypothetical protein [Catellatospora sp. NPDC049609]|uniref:hypothetical protein n=1 Tax=Catellatospora sp. NPDC049609 TaxID=3155505 RepID=UPI0034362265